MRMLHAGASRHAGPSEKVVDSKDAPCWSVQNAENVVDLRTFHAGASATSEKVVDSDTARGSSACRDAAVSAKRTSCFEKCFLIKGEPHENSMKA